MSKNSNYRSTNRSKHYLKCHLIFVCKYRKKLLQKGDQKLYGFLTGGFSTPVNDYVIDHLPLSVGLGAKRTRTLDMEEGSARRKRPTLSKPEPEDQFSADNADPRG